MLDPTTREGTTAPRLLRAHMGRTPLGDAAIVVDRLRHQVEGLDVLDRERIAYLLRELLADVDVWKRDHGC